MQPFRHFPASFTHLAEQGAANTETLDSESGCREQRVPGSLAFLWAHALDQAIRHINNREPQSELELLERFEVISRLEAMRTSLTERATPGDGAE